MKNMMKKLTFLTMLLCILSLAFIGCEPESPNVPPESNVEPEAFTGTVYHERVTGSDIPEISALVANVMGGEKGVLKVSTHNLKKPAEFRVNWDEVNVITDSVGVENYAFRLETSESDPLIFYNLIATRDENGELLDPVIAEYVTDPTFHLQWRLDADKLRDYTGEVYFYDLSGDEYSKSDKGAVLNTLRDGSPCPSITFAPSGPGFNIPNIYCWSYVTYGLCETQIEYGTGTGYHGSGNCQAGTGSPIMGYGVTCSTNPGGGGRDTQKGAGTGRCPSGGGGVPSLPGGIPMNPGSPGDADFGSFVGMLDNKLRLTLTEEEWLEEKPEVELVLELQLFLDSKGNSTLAKEYANKALDDTMLGYPVVIISPYVKYPKDSNYESRYPKLTKYLKEKLPTIASNQKVIDAINDLTDAPKDIIKEALEWGKGPEIRIEQLGGEGENEKSGVYRGHVYEDLQNVLFLDIDLVNQLEDADDPEFSNTLAFFIAVTILHEYTHLGDTVFGDNFWGDEWVESSFNEENEAGILFEEQVFGERVEISNAGVILKKIGGF